MLRIAYLTLAGAVLAASLPALAQTSPGSGMGLPGERLQSLPPSVQTAPGTMPSPSQQLQIQNYRNQLELQQAPAASVSPQGFRNQLEAGEQLNQLNQQLNQQRR